MEHWFLGEEIGRGGFGVVYKGVNRATKETAAVKHLFGNFKSWDECLRLPDVQAASLHKNKHIVRIIEVFREFDQVYIAYELMERSLLDRITSKTEAPLTEAEGSTIIRHVLKGLNFLHSRGIIHRDIKPENVLLTSSGDAKIGDLGNCRSLESSRPLTAVVSTIWYRAPELLLRSPVYGEPVDMWAVGVMSSEIMTGDPLFPGSDEADQITRVFNYLGVPDGFNWPKGVELFSKDKFSSVREQLLLRSGIPFDEERNIEKLSDEMKSFVEGLVVLDPERRMNVRDALEHELFEKHKEARRQRKLQSKRDSVVESVKLFIDEEEDEEEEEEGEKGVVPLKHNLFDWKK